jgi:hypothetical protein
MRGALRVSLIAAVIAGSIAVVSTVTAASGQSPNSCGRYLGIGWSDGYHSHSACPPKPKVIHQRPMGVPVVTTARVMPGPAPAAVPWWKIPATPTEAAPAEPMPSPDGSPSAGSAGQSLFREPGEGSSVTASSGPTQ